MPPDRRPVEPPRARTLPDLLVERAQAAGDELAIVSPLGTRTYGELAANAAVVAGGVRSLGAGAGDSVGLLVPNLPEWVDAAFGILTAGARVAAFNTWVKAWDLEYLLSHSKVRTLVTVDRVGRHDIVGELRGLLPEAWESPDGSWRSDRFPDLEHLVVIGDDVPIGALSWQGLVDIGRAEPVAEVVRPDPEDAAFVLYTSGSTEYPKAVPLVHRGLLENGFNIGERQGMTTEDRVWFASPLFWSFGAANAMMATFTHGARLVLQPQFDPEQAADLIAEQRCTVAYLLPTMTDALVAAVGERIRAVGSLRTGVTIGRPDEVARAVDDLGIGEICNVYGSTEVYGNCCVTPHDMPLGRRLTCQGPPLPGVELRIARPGSGEPCQPGEVGEIEVRGYVMPGYLGDDAATAKAMTADGWFRTGDLGSVDDFGCVEYSGRATEMIKSSGINVSPAEVERFVQSHPDVAEAVVVGVPHPIKGEAPVAFVCPRPGAALSGEQVVAFCRESIAGYKVPAAVVVRDEIPRTTTGKVSRRALEAEAALAIERSLASAGRLHGDRQPR